MKHILLLFFFGVSVFFAKSAFSQNKLDNPTSVPTDNPKKSNDSKSNAFKDMVKKHHNGTKLYKSGKIYLMTGLTAKFAKEDSLIFEKYQFTAVKSLDSVGLSKISKFMSDTTSFVKRAYKHLGVFQPAVSIELTDHTGAKEKFHVSLDFKQIANMDAQGQLNEKDISVEFTDYFAKLKSLYFVNPNSQAGLKGKTEVKSKTDEKKATENKMPDGNKKQKQTNLSPLNNNKDEKKN